MVNFRPVSFINPFANSPLQSAQVFVVARRSVRSFAHALQNPLSVLFYMDVAVAGLVGRRAVRGDDGRRPVLNGRVRSDEAYRIDVNAQFQALVLCEEILEPIFYGGAALQTATSEIHIIAVLGPKGGHGLGVAFLKGINERLGVIKNGFFVPLLLIRCASRQ